MNTQQKKETLWHISIDTKFGGNDWRFSLTTSEQSMLTMLRAAYGTFEAQLKELAKVPSGQRPSGLIDEALALLRCLVFNRLEPINGKYINLGRA